MPVRRKYDQGCGTAHALDVVGDRWSLLIVRELVLGPKRFTDLRAGLPGIGPNVLSQRLKELEQAGVLRQRTLPPPAASTVYELTDWGLELEEVIVQLGRWGARSPTMPFGAETQPDWLMLGMRAVYEPQADPVPTQYGFRFGDEEFWARVGPEGLRIGRGALPGADVVVTSEPDTIAKLMAGQLRPAAALKAGAVEIEGDKAAFQRFPSLFTIPPSPLSGEARIRG